jgi:hypothetical protein
MKKKAQVTIEYKTLYMYIVYAIDWSNECVNIV